MKINITQKSHQNTKFLGCDACDEQCCGSKIIYLTTSDFMTVSNYFPIFFYIKDGKISLVYFFYHKVGQKCIYLKNNLCSIYENRPYACRSYPFSYDQKTTHITMDSHCPELIDSTTSSTINTQGMTLIKNNKLNPDITSKYINPQMIKYANSIYGETDHYVNFCIENKLLAKFTQTYQDIKYDHFQKDFVNDLYVVSRPKLTVTILKKNHLFKDNRFKDFLKAQLHSIDNFFD